MSQDIEITMDENRLFEPTAEFSANAHISTREQYDEMYKESIENPEVFWGRIAETFTWKKKWDRRAEMYSWKKKRMSPAVWSLISEIKEVLKSAEVVSQIRLK